MKTTLLILSTLALIPAWKAANRGELKFSLWFLSYCAVWYFALYAI